MRQTSRSACVPLARLDVARGSHAGLFVAASAVRFCSVGRPIPLDVRRSRLLSLRLSDDDTTYEEIARVTGTSYTAVDRWMARGRNALRAARAGDEEPDRSAQ